MGGGLTSLTNFASFSSLAMHDSKRYRNLVVKKKKQSQHQHIHQ